MSLGLGLDVVLCRPDIPPNTGNIIRLCANTGCRLHLLRPLGFALDDRRMRRAGLDYHDITSVYVHDSLDDYLAVQQPARILALTTKGHHRFTELGYQDGDALLFGSETRGLPVDVLARIPPGQRLRIPMLANNRSLNLANAAAIVVYEAWRQRGFCGGM